MGHAFYGAFTVVVSDSFVCPHYTRKVINAYAVYAVGKVILKYGLPAPNVVDYLVLVTVRIIEILYVLTTVSIIGLLQQGGGEPPPFGSYLSVLL